MYEPLSKKLGLGRDERNKYLYNDCLDDLDQLSPNINILYTIIMNGFAEAREKGLTNLYIHGDSANYVAEEIINQMGTWIEKG